MWKNQNQNRTDLFGSSSSSSSNGNSLHREQQTALLFEQQNDFRMEELASKVSALNKITLDIQSEVHGQHALLDQNFRRDHEEVECDGISAIGKEHVLDGQRHCYSVSHRLLNPEQNQL
ncbi:hypothetical protein BGZ76_003061 [Entomortierella beljakovae]|nr:hypothetical protein BGZ76_003061 [Entomortierella beljakovae]